MSFCYFVISEPQFQLHSEFIALGIWPALLDLQSALTNGQQRVQVQAEESRTTIHIYHAHLSACQPEGSR